MTDSTRARLQMAGAVAVIAASAVAVVWFCWQIHALVFEIYALTAIFIAFRSAPPIRRWLAGLPSAHRLVFYALLAAVVAGHFTSDKRTYYPFVAWDIFSAVSEQETVFCRELVGTTTDGKSVRLLVEQLFPSITQFDLPTKEQPEQMEQLVLAMAKIYNRQHAADPLREVDLMLMAVKLHPQPGRSFPQPSCELLQRYNISSAPSS